MLVIWGRANSSNVKKVLWCAEELGLEFDRRDAGGSHGITDSQEFLALNPNGLVPCIEDDGFVLWESNAIVRYLVARYGDDTTLLPPTLEERASADRWMDWSNATLMGPYATLMQQLFRTPHQHRDATLIETANHSFNKALAIADAALDQRQWFSGSSFGIGDIPLGVLIYGFYQMPVVERPTLPALEAWLARLQLRPAYKEWVAKPLP